MKVRAEWQGGLKFFGYDEHGHRSVFDSGPDSENTAGPAPMQMFLEALITCAGMDIVYILRKRRKKIERFFVEVEAERADKHPKIFKNIQVKYYAAGEGINEYEMDRALNLSVNKFCSIIAMLDKTKTKVEITYEILS